jgi:hypothetical protein
MKRSMDDVGETKQNPQQLYRSVPPYFTYSSIIQAERYSALVSCKLSKEFCNSYS